MEKAEKIPKIGQGFVINYLVQSGRINEWYPDYKLLGTQLEVGTGICDMVLFSPKESKRFVLLEVEISRYMKSIAPEKIQKNKAIKAIFDHLTRLRKGLSIFFDVPYHRIKYGVVLNPEMVTKEVAVFIRQKGVDVWDVHSYEVRSFYKKKFGLEIVAEDL